LSRGSGGRTGVGAGAGAGAGATCGSGWIDNGSSGGAFGVRRERGGVLRGGGRLANTRGGVCGGAENEAAEGDKGDEDDGGGGGSGRWMRWLEDAAMEMSDEGEPVLSTARDAWGGKW
jgi:hypothetical protein